jgi:hypothetical protein
MSQANLHWLGILTDNHSPPIVANQFETRRGTQNEIYRNPQPTAQPSRGKRIFVGASRHLSEARNACPICLQGRRTGFPEGGPKVCDLRSRGAGSLGRIDHVRTADIDQRIYGECRLTKPRGRAKEIPAIDFSITRAGNYRKGAIHNSPYRMFLPAFSTERLQNGHETRSHDVYLC